MAAKFPGSRWVVHVFYWLLLIGGYYYFQGRIDRQMQVQRALGSCLQAACAAVNQQNEKMMMDINLFADAYRHDISESFRAKAQQATRSTSRFQDTLSALEAVDGALSVSPNHSLSISPQIFRQLQDSLLLTYRPVEEINTEISQLLTGDPYQLAPERLNNFLETASRIDRSQMLNNLQLHAVLALQKALLYYYINTMPDVNYTLNRLTPTLSPKKWCLKTGELFEADIFLSGYSDMQHYTEATVNGEPFPVRDGMLRFSRRFETPGEHPLTVTLKYANPLTNEMKTFIRTFQVYIQPR